MARGTARQMESVEEPEEGSFSSNLVKLVKWYLRASQAEAEAEAEKKKLSTRLKKALATLAFQDLSEKLPEIKKTTRSDDPYLQRVLSIIKNKAEEEALKLTKVVFDEKGVKLQNVNQDRSTIDPDIAIQYIDTLLETAKLDPVMAKQDLSKLKACIKTKRVIDEDAIQTAMDAGLIIPDDFRNTCVKENIIVTIRASQSLSSKG